MSKYGRGLNREIVAAINSGIIQEPFSVAQVMKLIKIKQWIPQPSLLDINVNLSNASSKVQSPTDEKYFRSLDRGLYMLNPEYKGEEWI